jgi:hypothetical protein
MPPQRSTHHLYQTTLPSHWPQQSLRQLTQIPLSYVPLSLLELSVTTPETFQMSPPSHPILSSHRKHHPQQASPSPTLSSQTSGAPTLPQLMRQVACKTLPFRKPQAQPQPSPQTIDLTQESTPPRLPPLTTIDLRSPSLTPIQTLCLHDTSRSPSYHVHSLSLTPARSTPVIPETHLRDHQWTPITPDPDGTILPNPLNTPYILTCSPTP